MNSSEWLDLHGEQGDDCGELTGYEDLEFSNALESIRKMYAADRCPSCFDGEYGGELVTKMLSRGVISVICDDCGAVVEEERL